MCGIAGILSLTDRPVYESEVRSMCGVLRHRGPDHEGVYARPGVGLGMRRLSIIDLETGEQPVTNEDGSAWVVFNGEIYNFKDLRADLTARGHTFRSKTDTEALVHSYEERGKACVESLRGMFAFAVWDERKRELLLARDRLGIKPLYYAEVGGRLVFASEVKAILQLPEVERRINWRSLACLLRGLTTPSRESIVQGIHKLPPGHTLVASARGGVRVERYWRVAFRPDRERSEASFIEGLRHVLSESVRLHLASDVPLGVFLSGGIDSTAITALAAPMLPQPIKTFSIGFADADYNELPQAREVAAAVGADHHELMVEPDVLSVVDDLTWHMDEPFGDVSAIPTYMVSKLAARHVRVVLSGDGGDELFAGYDKYRVEGRERLSRFVPASLRAVLGAVARQMPEGVRGRNSLRHFSLPWPDRYFDAVNLFRRDEALALLTPEVAEQALGDDPYEEEAQELARDRGHWLSALQSRDLEGYLPLDILTKVDRMSMAHSIEARPPLLDHVLVELAATIPPEMQMRAGSTKHLFKKALRGLVPDAVLDRPKTGFGIPLGRWFGGPMEAFAREALLSEKSRARHVFDVKAIERLFDREAGDGGLGLRLWTLISFELWCRTFLDRTGSPRIDNCPSPERKHHAHHPGIPSEDRRPRAAALDESF